MQKNCRLPLTALKNLDHRTAYHHDFGVNKYDANSKSGRVNRAIDAMSAATAEVIAGVIFKARIAGKVNDKRRLRKSLPNYNKVGAIAVHLNKRCGTGSGYKNRNRLRKKSRKDSYKIRSVAWDATPNASPVRVISSTDR